MPSHKRQEQDKNKSNEMKIKPINKPTKEGSRKKTKELSEFLSKTWHIPIHSE